MFHVLIRLDHELSDELVTAFPQRAVRHHPASTTLTGEIADNQELQGILALLDLHGIQIVDLITIPSD
jgi:hypothetical protein